MSNKPEDNVCQSCGDEVWCEDDLGWSERYGEWCCWSCDYDADRGQPQFSQAAIDAALGTVRMDAVSKGRGK